MLKTLFKVALIVVILVAVGGFLLGWWSGGGAVPLSREEIGTTGNAVSERAQEAAGQARYALEDGAISSKIKSKMALDDTVEALRIDVDTSNRVVTLTGTVETEAQRQRALQLARETEGVREVVDRLKIRR